MEDSWRSFPKGGILLAALLLVVALAAACSSGDEEGTTGASTAPTAVPTSDSPAAAAPEPTTTGEPKVKTLVIADAAPSVESNNPWKLENPRTPYFMRPIYESLIGADPDTGDFVPQLAESWSIEPDGTSVRFMLRKGVRFHGDNGEFTAADVVATHAVHTQEDSVHTHRTQYRKVTPEVVNDYEIVFRTDTPNPELIPNISERNTISMEPFSAKDMEALGGDPDLASRPPAGTGFYQYADRFQGQFFRMERVPYDHWQAKGDFEEIEFRFIGEASTRLAGLLAGEIHMAQLPEDLQVQAVNEGLGVARAKVLARERSLLYQGVNLDKNYIGYEAQGTSCGYTHCDTPFLDVRVRKALNKAVDRDALNQAFFGGEGVEIHNLHLIPTGSYWNADWDRNFQAEYGYDPQAARDLLAEAGYGPNNPLELALDGTPSGGLPEKVDVAEAVVGFWREIGVKPTLDQTDAATIRSRDRVLGNKNRIEFQTSNIVETQAFRVHHYSLESPRDNTELLELDDAVKAQRSSVDPVKALAGLRQVGDLIYPLHIGVPLFWVPDDIIYDSDIVASYEWSGVPLGTYSHFQRIKAVRE